MWKTLVDAFEGLVAPGTRSSAPQTPTSGSNPRAVSKKRPYPFPVLPADPEDPFPFPECSVCDDATSTIVASPCGHSTCSACFEAWFLPPSSKSVCMLCRTTVTSAKTHAKPENADSILNEATRELGARHSAALREVLKLKDVALSVTKRLNETHEHLANLFLAAQERGSVEAGELFGILAVEMSTAGEALDDLAGTAWNPLVKALAHASDACERVSDAVGSGNDPTDLERAKSTLSRCSSGASCVLTTQIVLVRTQLLKIVTETVPAIVTFFYAVAPAQAKALSENADKLQAFLLSSLKEVQDRRLAELHRRTFIAQSRIKLLE